MNSFCFFRHFLAVFFSVCLVAVCNADGAQPINDLNTESISAPAKGTWPSYGLDYQEQRFSPLTSIDTTTVSQLGLDWFFDMDYARGAEATPLVIDGVMYVSGSWSVVYALDAKTGRQIWKYDPKVPKITGIKACCGPVNRGVAAYRGKIFVGSLDARLIALDAESGKPIWEVNTADRSDYPYTITGAPRVAKGKVFIGNGGAEFGVRGYVSAYDVNTGELAWRFYTVPGNPADGYDSAAERMAAKTWTGEWWKLGGGGTVWDSIVYDPELDQLYIGVGNGSPWDRSVRSPDGGDNLFLSSIVALNPDTGEYLWHYQEVPSETWDYTATQSIVLANMDIKGESRKVIWHAPKNGFFFIIDRQSGKLISAEAYSRQNWALGYDVENGRPIFNPDADWTKSEKEVLVYPSSAGAHNWPPMAYSPQTGLVYIPEQVVAGPFKQRPYQHKKNTFNLGTLLTGPTIDNPLLMEALGLKLAKGYLLAWDPVKQKAAWRLKHSNMGNGGVLATAGGLVFQGTVDRDIIAVNASSGKRLWAYHTQDVPLAPPISYEIDGEQYLAVTVGRGGILGLTAPLSDEALPSSGRVLVFKLGANTELPPATVKIDYGDPPLPTVRDADVLAKGEALYREYCFRCHAVAGASNRRIPDLRRLNRGFYDAFEAIVYDGAVESLGMPGFSEHMSQDDVAAVKAYLLIQAEKDKALRSQPRWWLAVQKAFYSMLATIIGWII